MTSQEDAIRNFFKTILQDPRKETTIMLEDAVQFADLEREGDGIVDESEDLEERIIRQETSQTLRKALDSLSVDQRQVIQMTFFDEMQVEEIAARLGVHRNTVNNRLQNGLKNLRKILCKSDLL